MIVRDNSHQSSSPQLFKALKMASTELIRMIFNITMVFVGSGAAALQSAVTLIQRLNWRPHAS